MKNKCEICNESVAELSYKNKYICINCMDLISSEKEVLEFENKFNDKKYFETCEEGKKNKLFLKNKNEKM